MPSCLYGSETGTKRKWVQIQAAGVKSLSANRYIGFDKIKICWHTKVAKNVFSRQ